MTTTRDVMAMLSELVALTTLEEESPQSFKVRAYENARGALVCDVCEAPLPQHAVRVCALCTYANDAGASACAVCEGALR